VLAAKQMSFELFCECVNGKRRGPQFDWESVPRLWPGHREVTPADGGPCTWHIECAAVRQPQLPPADDGQDRSADISQVGWCQTMQALINHHSQLETDMLPDWKPVKIMQNWSDMVELPEHRHGQMTYDSNTALALCASRALRAGASHGNKMSYCNRSYHIMKRTYR